MIVQTGTGHRYRQAHWLERVTAGSARRAPQWLRHPLKRAYARLLSAMPGEHLVCRLPGGEAFRVDAEYRQLAWNDDEYAAFKAVVTPGATVLDVGANVGAYTLLFATWIGASGRVVAFEPASASREGLAAHLAINGLADRVTIRSEAVSDRTGSVQFTNTGTHGDNRIVRGADCGTSIVPSITIDDVCASLRLVPDVIKIDVEGSELSALRGASRTIASRGSALALFVELHPRTWPSLGIIREDLERELQRQKLVLEPPRGVVDPWSLEGVAVRVRPA